MFFRTQCSSTSPSYVAIILFAFFSCGFLAVVFGMDKGKANWLMRPFAGRKPLTGFPTATSSPLFRRTFLRYSFMTQFSPRVSPSFPRLISFTPSARGVVWSVIFIDFSKGRYLAGACSAFPLASEPGQFQFSLSPL